MTLKPAVTSLVEPDVPGIVMNTTQHWDKVYSTKAPEAVSWYAPHLRETLDYILRTGLPKTASVLGVGGGEATLVDDLLDTGYTDVSVLDISSHALEVCTDRDAQE